MIENGGFETRTFDGWSRLRNRITIETAGPINKTHGGEFMARIWPDTDSLATLISKVYPVANKDKIVSARLEFWLLGHTLESLAARDVFGSAIGFPNVNCDTGACFDLLTAEDGARASREWVQSSIDVTKFVSDKVRGPWQLVFQASNDISQDSWWDLDDVSLTICTRP